MRWSGSLSPRKNNTDESLYVAPLRRRGVDSITKLELIKNSLSFVASPTKGRESFFIPHTNINELIVEYRGLQWFYGQFVFVSSGKCIGRVGHTGNAQLKAAHLHYSIITLLPYPGLMIMVQRRDGRKCFI